MPKIATNRRMGLRPIRNGVWQPFAAQNFEQISNEQGFARRSVVCIVQDSRGFLWFGTRNGLSRYDGYNFLLFRHDPGNPLSLSHNHVTSIAENPSGDLWIGTNGNGLNEKTAKNP